MMENKHRDQTVIDKVSFVRLGMVFRSLIVWCGAIAILNGSLGFATNPTGGGGGGGGGCGGQPNTCTDCEGNSFTVPPTESCPSSFNMNIPVGYADIERGGDFLVFSREGLNEGQAGRGHYRSFDEVRSQILNRGNKTNREMQNLSIVSPRVDERLYSPQILAYLKLRGTEYLEEGGLLRQIRTQSAFTDVTTSEDGYRVRTWPITELNRTKVDGFYEAPNSDPTIDIRFSNPDFPNLNNRLQVVQMEYGKKLTKLYDQSNPDLLIVQTFSGLDTTGDLLEELTLSYQERGEKPWDYTIEREIKRADLVDGVIGGLQTVYHVKERHEDYSLSPNGGDDNGKRLMERILAPDSPTPQVTVFDYYRDPENRYIHGRIKSQEDPDGNWKYWEYIDSETSNTAVETKYYPWKNTPIDSREQGVKEVTTITKNLTERVTTINGVQVAKERFTTSEDPSTRAILSEEAKWDGSEWHPVISFYAPYSQNDASSQRLLSMINADGTAETYSYSFEGKNLRITTRTGAMNPNADISAPLSFEDVVSGDEVSRLYNAFDVMIEERTSDIETGLELEVMIVVERDEQGRPLKTIYNDPNDYSEVEYNCCGIGYERDRNGAQKWHKLDGLGRRYETVMQRSSNGPEIVTQTDFIGLTKRITRSAGGETLLVSESTKSLDGLTSSRLSPDADGDGNPELTNTHIVRDGNGDVSTTTYPDGSTSIAEDFIDGQTASVSGTQVPDVTYDYLVHDRNGGGKAAVVTQSNGTESITTYRDQLGRIFEMAYADGAASQVQYYRQTATLGARGRQAAAIDPDGVSQSFEYDEEGDLVKIIDPLSNNQVREMETIRDVVSDVFVGNSRRVKSYVNGVLTITSWKSPQGYKSKSESYGLISTRERTIPNDGVWAIAAINQDGTSSVQNYVDGLMSGTASYVAEETTPFTSMVYTYDAFGRRLTATDARTGTLTYGAYLENGSFTSMTDAGNRTTGYSYDNMGRQVAVDLPDTVDATGATVPNITLTSYYPTGQIKATWGDQTYATLNLYDEQNRRVGLRTYQNLAHGTEPIESTSGYAETQWDYDAVRGWLNQKRYADGNGPSYTYTAAGRLASRMWARGIVTNYGYDNGQLVTTDYSDTTPDIAYEYDNFGRQTLITQGRENSWVFSYDSANLRLNQETITYGINTATPFTRVIDRSQRDALLRPSGFALKDGATDELAIVYTYDNAGRLKTIAEGGDTFTYHYLTDSTSLIESIDGPAHTVTNIWDTTRNALLEKKNTVGSNEVSYYSYLVNAIGQRTSLGRSGTAFASSQTETIGYNAVGEVVDTIHSLDPARNRQYQFDGIGNRESTTEGGNPAVTYATNMLNQYADVGGSVQTHDVDGNLTDEGKLQYRWDGENRLVEVLNQNNESVATYEYDYQSRRIAKIISDEQVSWIYDGWNPVGVYNEQAEVETVYTWGIDLSGSMQGAGGIGGLLKVNKVSDGNFYATYDGNGNVSDYLDGGGQTVAHYEYDAFGNIVEERGMMAPDFLHRYSTKHLDSESVLYFYGFRYYNSQAGRWVSRDPIGEAGGANLYGFLGNDGAGRVDFLGLSGLTESECEQYVATAKQDSFNANILRQISEDPNCNSPDIGCECCVASNPSFDTVGGYHSGSGQNAGGSRVRICWGGSVSQTQASVTRTLRHELIHTLDACDGPFDCEEAACSEIRAYNLMGGSPMKGPGNKAIIRSRALASLKHNGSCGDTVEERTKNGKAAINKVFDRCYSDHTGLPPSASSRPKGPGGNYNGPIFK